MLSSRRFYKFNAPQQWRQVAKSTEALLSALRKLKRDPHAAISLTVYIDPIRQYLTWIQDIRGLDREGREYIVMLEKGAKVEDMPMVERLYGIACAASGLELSEKDFGIRTVDRPGHVRRFDIHVVLDNIRSAFNVGGIFRTCDAAGVGHVYTCGYTAAPGNPKLEKTALGATSTVQTHQCETVFDAMDQLRAKNVPIYAFETADQALNLCDPETANALGMPLAIILGNETMGVPPSVLAQCDGCLELPMVGVKNSLNVACAFSAGIYTILNHVGLLHNAR